MLSLVGRITLVRSVLLSIPNYFMQTVEILNTVCNELEKIAHGFIWRNDAGGHKPSLVKWADCCQPLANGGLGLRCLKEQNDSFLLKLRFNFLFSRQALWVQILRAKYKVAEVCPMDIWRRPCSFMWRSLSKVWPFLRQCFAWYVGDGRRIKVWMDNGFRHLDHL